MTLARVALREVARMSRVWLVGECNPCGDDPEMALYPHPANSAGGRLCDRILGMTTSEYLTAFNRTNLCRVRWDPVEARTRALALLLLADREKRSAFVLLGRRVANVFRSSSGTLPRPLLRTWTVESGGGWLRLLTLPHPSGRVRTWNEPGAVERARLLVEEVRRWAAER